METGTQTPDTSAGVPAFNAAIEDDDIQITPAARQKMAEILSDTDPDEAEAIRVFVTGGGCSGMTYGMTFADRRQPTDCVREAEGVRLYVDAVALQFLKGAQIDFQELPGGESFVFNNVFAATGGSGTCGACGNAGG